MVRDGHCPAIRIEEQLFAIETEASLRFEGCNRSIPVELPRFESGNKEMPVVVGPVFLRIKGHDTRGFPIIDPIEQE
jgi:hypothetical protein